MTTVGDRGLTIETATRQRWELDAALLGLFASSISGVSMNPARTLGQESVGNDYTGDSNRRWPPAPGNTMGPVRTPREPSSANLRRCC